MTYLNKQHWDNKNCTSGKGQVNKNGNLVMSFSSKVTTETERQFPHSQFNFATRFNNRVKGNDSRRRTTTQQDYIYFVRFPSVAGLQKIVWGVLIQQSSIFGQRNKKRKSLEIPVPVHRGRGNENLRFLLS